MSDAHALDKVGEAHWSGRWAVPGRADVYHSPDQPGVAAHNHRRLARTLDPIVAGVARPGATPLEVGAANSIWLPYFARKYGYHVTGLDYSHNGCQLAEARLRSAGIEGAIIEGDLFE